MASWEEFSRIVAEAKASKKLDPVGQEDDDVDNDGDSDSSDSYLKKRRATVGAAIAADRKKKVSEALDPVGQEDKDIDNDGDHDKSDKYLLNRRKVRAKVIPPQERLKTDRDMFNIPKSEQEAARERTLAKAKAKRMKEEVEQIDEAGDYWHPDPKKDAQISGAGNKMRAREDKASASTPKPNPKALRSGESYMDYAKRQPSYRAPQPKKGLLSKIASKLKGGGSSAAGVSGGPSGVTGRFQVGGGQGYGISGIKLANSYEPEGDQIDEFWGPKTATPKNSPSGTKSVEVNRPYPAKQNNQPVDVTYNKAGEKKVTPMPRARAGMMNYKYGSTWGLNLNSYEPEGKMVEEDKEYRREMRKAAARERAEEKKAETEFRSRGRRGEKKKGPKLSTTPITDRTAKSYVDKELGAIKYMERKTKGKHTVGNPFPENYDFGGEYIEEGGMSKDEMLSAIKGHKYSKKELLDMSKKSTKEGRHGEAAAFYHEFQKEANEIEEAKKSDYLNDKLPSDEKLGYGFSDNKKRVKDLKKLKRLVKHYDGMKKGDPMYNSYQPEGEIVDEGLFSINRSAPLRMGHGPRIKNAPAPIRSSQTPIKTSSSQVTSGPKITQTQNNSYQPEGEQLDEKALSRAQQRFMGMVYAAKKGETPASPEVAKAASGMSKKAARDFAKTKHEGLPEKKEETKEELSLVDRVLIEASDAQIMAARARREERAKKQRARLRQAKVSVAGSRALKDEEEETPKRKSEAERKAKAKEEVKQTKRGKSDPSARVRSGVVRGAAKVKAEQEKTKRQRERQEYERGRREEKRSEREEKNRKRQEDLETKLKEKKVKAAQTQSDREEARKEKTKSEIKGALKSAAKSIKFPSAVSDKGRGSTGATIDQFGDTIGSVVGAVGKAGRGMISAKLKERGEKKKEEKRAVRHEKIRQEMSKEEFSNWREEFIFEIDDQSIKEPQEKIIDVSKKKNKIEINPNMSEENIQEIAPLVGILARVAGGAATRGIAARGAGFAARGALEKKAVDIAAQKGGEMTADMVQKRLEKKFKNEDEGLEEGMTLKDFKKKRSAQKQKEKRAAEKTSPLRRAGIHDDKASPERDARHRANVDPDFDGDDSVNYPGGKLKNPKKIRKAKALGELGESAAWTKKEGKSEAGGLNEKGRKSYERENPGSDLKAPSKKVGNPRRASFCARMSGMKAKLTSKKTANDPDSRINKSLRAWNC